ncbi:MAG: hypothetical protein OEZ13_09950 [Spirochaetia bacterium]|nr:hypothetical protein [Spirochaetia bacterium]
MSDKENYAERITLISVFSRENLILRKNLSVISNWLKKNKNLKIKYLIFYDKPFQLKNEASRFPFLQFWRVTPFSYKSSFRLLKTIRSKSNDNILVFLPENILIFPKDILHLANTVNAENKPAAFLKPVIKYQKKDFTNMGPAKNSRILYSFRRVWINEKERLYNIFYKNSFYLSSDMFAVNIRIFVFLFKNMSFTEKKIFAKLIHRYFKKSALDYKFLFNYLAENNSMKIASVNSKKSRIYFKGFPHFFLYRQILTLLRQSFYIKRRVPSLSRLHFLMPVIQLTQIIMLYSVFFEQEKAAYFLLLFLAFVFPYFYRDLSIKNPIKALGKIIMRFFVYLSV